MREIRSPLDGIPSPFAARAALDAYLVGAYKPKVVADFAGIYSTNEYYRTGGSASTFSDMFTHARASNATMVDSDGLLKWAPHNLVLRSDAIATSPWSCPAGPTVFTATDDAATTPEGDSATSIVFQAGKAISAASPWSSGGVTTIVGVKYSVSIDILSTDLIAFIFQDGGGQGVNFNTSTGAVSGQGNGAGSSSSLGSGWWRLTYTFTAVNTTSYLYMYPTDGGTSVGGETFYLARASMYRSDLGGMVNNSDTASTYVPTTSSPVYLPRRNHYGWNGSSYVNKGLLLETEARTNLVTSSDDMTTWTNTNTTDAKTQTGADGVSNSATLITATAGNGTILTTITAASANYVFSALVKRITGTGTVEMTIDGTNWVDVTSDINTSQYVQVGTGAGANTTNPQVGFRLVTSGDEIAVQVNQLEATSGQFSSPMPTTGASDTRALETLTIPAAKMAWNASNVSLQMQGEITYADEGTTEQQTFARWHAGATDYIIYDLDTDSTDTGEVNFNQEDATGGAGSVAIDAYTAGVNTAYNISGRHTSGAINGATDGTATTEDTTPTALPDLSTTDFQLGYDYMGTIALFREDNNDWGDAGIAEAST